MRVNQKTTHAEAFFLSLRHFSSTITFNGLILQMPDFNFFLFSFFLNYAHKLWNKLDSVPRNIKILDQ